MLFGVLLWVNALFLPVACAVVLLLCSLSIVREKSSAWWARFGTVLGGIVTAFAPTLAYALTHNFDNFKAVFKDARGMEARVAAIKAITPRLLTESLPHNFGVRDAWADGWTWPALGLVVMLGVLVAVLSALLSRRSSAVARMLALSMHGVCAAQTISKHGDPHQRRPLRAVGGWSAFRWCWQTLLQQAWAGRWSRLVAASWLILLTAFHGRFVAQWHGP